MSSIKILISKKTTGHTLIGLLISLSLYCIFLSSLCWVYQSAEKIYHTQVVFINIENNTRFILSILRSDIKKEGDKAISRYRIDRKKNQLYRQNDHGQFQLLSDGISDIRIFYDKFDNKHLTGISIVLYFIKLGRAERVYNYVAI